MQEERENQQPQKTPLGFWQLWNTSFGFFGIQFGWTLQIANTSAIYGYLGANPEQIPILWLAAPLTGLFVPPIVGYMSDRTWGPLGRRRPYFLVGAILASVALILMPNSSSLWMAVGALWMLDTAVNVSQEPFRAFVSDTLPEKQSTRGFAMQSFFFGFGAVVASLCPWILNHVLNVSSLTNVETTIPLTVKISYYLGAAVFLGAIVWTVVTTKEYSPEDLNLLQKRLVKQGGLFSFASAIFASIRQMPTTMRQLAWVQFFTWLGFFSVVLYFPPAVGYQIFGAPDETSQLYTNGVEWAGLCIALYNVVCFLFSLSLSKLVALTSRKAIYAFCLLCGGAALISLLFIRDQYLMLLPMACFGLTWAAALSMPYAILSELLPEEETGVYMGIFNSFIVLPQVIASVGLGWVMKNFLGNNSLMAVVLGGVFLVVAAVSVSGVKKVTEEGTADTEAVSA